MGNKLNVKCAIIIYINLFICDIGLSIVAAVCAVLSIWREAFDFWPQQMSVGNYISHGPVCPATNLN